MALGPDNKFTLRTAQMTGAQARDADIDVGLRAYMLKVYNYMCIALGLTGAVAFAVSSSPTLMQAIFGTPLKWVVLAAPIAFGFMVFPRMRSMKASSAQIAFWVYAGLLGLLISSYFLVYTGESVTRVFFITSGAFAGLSLYGYTTKRDLGPIGAFLTYGAFGVMIAIVINWFLKSPALMYTYSFLGVFIFGGLTAYDTQKIKQMYRESDGAEIGEKKAVFGALTLYGDFVMMFIFLMNLLGNRE